MIEKLKEIITDSEILNDNDLFNEKLKDLLNSSIQSDLASLYLYNKQTQHLDLKLYYDRKENIVRNVNDNHQSLSMIEPRGCIGKAFLTKKPAIHNYITSDKDYFQSYDNELNYKLKSQLIYPIVENDELLGIFRISTTIKSGLKKYTSKEMELVNNAVPYLIQMIKNILSSKHININDFYFPPKSDTLDTKEDESIDDNDMLLFLSNTVHDIRTPANSLYGFLELLEEQIEDKRLKEFVINAKESASFINTLTDSILETAKSRYQSTLSSELVVPSIKFFSDIANTFSSQILEKKIHYFIFISPDIPKEIKIDTLKLKRILTNLIGNAYKFTPVKHQIDLQILWNASNHRIKFSIKDTGIGIDEEGQKKLFKAFSQASEDTHKKYGGSGLGLSISAAYVSDMGGELKLKSKANEGSEFYFDIPVEIIDNTPSYEKFYNLEKKIVILTEYTQARYPKFIEKYLIALGMPKEKIVISDKVEDDATHIIAFEEKVTPELLESGRAKKFKLLLIEQTLFSLLNRKEFSDVKITSKNVYNAEAIYSTIFSGKKPKVLIVDDNKINVTLLESMLAGEYVDISTALDAEEALEYLKNSAKKKEAFDIVYLDKHMNAMSGTDLLHKYRKFEVKHELKPIFAVSITGDPDISENEKRLYNSVLQKPFNKSTVQEVISLYKQ